MEVLVKVMDGIILQFLWICHLIYNVFGSVTKSHGKIKAADQDNNLHGRNHNERRHFIHLYSHPSNTGKPTCYMDVYPLSSSSEEEKLRSVSSKRAPNKTFLRHNENHKYADPWMEYSAMAR
ncbi:hypothetical protein JTB14_022308 [Gonioctena quinquepunctata]|nr:hypothetical protein JTB14_022308 [Gonioctena quinquepunctata]